MNNVELEKHLAEWYADLALLLSSNRLHRKIHATGEGCCCLKVIGEGPCCPTHSVKAVVRSSKE